MKTSIEVTKATALMMEALQKKYEAVCLAVAAVEEFCDVSDSRLKGLKQEGWGEKEIKAHRAIFSKQADEICDKIYSSAWGFEDALWGLLCDMARDKALNEIEGGKIFNRI